MNYKLAILIPTKDRQVLLKRALDSIVCQTVLPDEIIVVNDGSKDGTDDFLDKFSIEHNNLKFKIINKKENGGVNAARNIGISVSRSDWIAFLDDDDEFIVDAINKIKTAISLISSDINVVYFNSIIDNGEFRYPGGFQFLRGQKEYDPTYEETMTKFNLVGDCKPVFRKKLFDDDLYKFPETVNGYESYTMNLIARDNKGIRYINDLSTIIHFDNTHTHLSHSGPIKDPKSLLFLHIKQLTEHEDFYRSHPKQLANKYISIIKLSVRARKIYYLLYYCFVLFLNKLKT